MGLFTDVLGVRGRKAVIGRRASFSLEGRLVTASGLVTAIRAGVFGQLSAVPLTTIARTYSAMHVSATLAEGSFFMGGSLFLRGSTIFAKPTTNFAERSFSVR